MDRLRIPYLLSSVTRHSPRPLRPRKTPQLARRVHIPNITDLNGHQLSHLRVKIPRQHFSSVPPPPKPSQHPQSLVTPSPNPTRIDRLLARLPRRLHPHLSFLRSAPGSHVAAFLLLHELTAVIPLLGLFGLFHYTNYVPLDWVTGHFGDYVRDGVGKFERWFKRKGWFGFSKEDDMHGREELGAGDAREVLGGWEHGKDARYKILVEIGLAWAITKAMLPVRIVASVWATPWFARVLVGMRTWAGFGKWK